MIIGVLADKHDLLRITLERGDTSEAIEEVIRKEFRSSSGGILAQFTIATKGKPSPCVFDLWLIAGALDLRKCSIPLAFPRPAYLEKGGLKKVTLAQVVEFLTAMVR